VVFLSGSESAGFLSGGESVGFLSGGESAGFLSFIYICIAVGDLAIKRGGMRSH